MSINFILQAIRIIHIGNYTDTELQMIYDFLRNVDNDILISYFNTNTIVLYNNDLELYIEMIDKLIKIYEEQEEYEKCIVLMDKKHESQLIMKTKLEKNECT